MYCMKLAILSQKILRPEIKTNVAQKTKVRSSLKINPSNVSVLLYIAIFSVALLYGTHAKPLDTLGLSSKLITRGSVYAPQYALDLSGDVYSQNDGENAEIDNTMGMIEDAPIRPSRASVSF